MERGLALLALVAVYALVFAFYGVVGWLEERKKNKKAK